MFTQNEKAIGCNQMALGKHLNKRNINQKSKRKPAYYREYLRYKDSDLIVLCRDWNSVNVMRRLKGRICLLCDDAPDSYDLSFCCDKEVWVLCETKTAISAAMELARTVQFNGAHKVVVILVDVKNLREVQNDSY